MGLTRTRLALLVGCPTCAAEPAEGCWDDDGRDQVDLHDERMELYAKGRALSDFDDYNDDGTFRR